MKQIEPRSIEVNHINMESVMEHLGYGNGIIFVTDGGKLVGAITEGDINRCLRKGQYVIDNEMVNCKITALTETDESSDLFVEADKVFRSRSKIHNIPVVDKEGILLYQIDREDNIFLDRIKEYLIEIKCYKAIGVCLECYEVEHIVLIGGDLDTRVLVRDFIEEELAYVGLESKIDITVSTDLAQCNSFSDSTMVICLSDILTYYLRQTLSFHGVILSIKEISAYHFYTELVHIRKDTVEDFIELFGYDAICFYDKNKYNSKILNWIEQLGISIHREKRNFAMGIRQTDLLAYSLEGKYEERLSLLEFSSVLQRMQGYKCIGGEHLTKDCYIREYVACLKAIQKEGFGGIIFKHYNSLDCEVFNAIRKLKDFSMIGAGGQRKAGIQYINVTKEPENMDDLKINLKYMCIATALVNVCHDVVCRCCNNVYVHKIPWDSRSYSRYIDKKKTMENYLLNKNDFTLGFVETMYGKKDFPVEKLISSMNGCSIVRVNEGYMKFQSNYVSEFFNTDTYGNRNTVNMPQEYIGTIWLMGTCVYSGYAVEDAHTLASELQRIINEQGIKYRVINFSVVGLSVWDQIEKMREAKTGVHDIAICWVNTMWNREEDSHVITLNLHEFMGQLGREDYWDMPTHCGRKGYAVLAKQLFENISPKLLRCSEKRFRVEDLLEREIAAFVADIRKMVNWQDNIEKMDSKVGAIVMNCNPFTYGHQYLIETASRLVDYLYIFVVEENKSVFPFADRFCMVKEGVKNFPNVTVLPSGKFMISSVTFPGYFMKENPDGRCYDSFLDLKIFAHYIAPALNISKRFIGEEPFDKVTAQYNYDMKLILGDMGIEVFEIPRKKYNDEVISATKVRKLMETGKLNLLQSYVPESTLKYIRKGIEKELALR